MKRLCRHVVVIFTLLISTVARAQTLNPMPNALFNCFAQTTFTLSPTGVITPGFVPTSCFQSTVGFFPSMDWTSVYNWQKQFPTGQPGAADAYLAGYWNGHCSNCSPPYSTDPAAYSYVYVPPTATPAPSTPTPVWTPAPTAVPSAGPTPIPIPWQDTTISGWDFGTLAYTMDPVSGAISGVTGPNAKIPPGANPFHLWYAALEQGEWFPAYYTTTGQPLPIPWPGYANIWETVPDAMKTYLTSLNLGSAWTPPAAVSTPWPVPSAWPTATSSAPWTPSPSGSATPPWTPAPSASTTPAPTATWTAIPSWWSTPICTTGVLDPPWPTSYCEVPTPTPTSMPTPLPNINLTCPAGTAMPPGCWLQ